MCLRNLKKIWCMYRSRDIALPTPSCICSTWPSCGHWHSAHGWVNTSQVVYTCSYVSQEPPKNLVHGVLIEVEILTSPLPHVFAQFGPVWGTGAPPMNVSTPPKWSRNVSMCLLLKDLVHGVLIEVEILTSPLPHVFAQLGPVLGTGYLPTGVSTPSKWSRNVPMCLLNLQNNCCMGS